MDKSFLKTLSERDRDVLENCFRMANKETEEQVKNIWAIREEVEKNNLKT